MTNDEFIADCRKRLHGQLGASLTEALDRLEALIGQGQEERDYTPAQICTDCDGYGTLGHASDGRLISCESCGGHEDSIGSGVIRAAFAADKIEKKEKK